MPIATKRKVEARKEAPIIEVEPEPQPLGEQPAPQPKVTALVFSYDSAPALRRCLAALEGSNDRALIEILVVDCGSHDESPQLDSEFDGVTILRLPRYFGRTKALNIATRTAARRTSVPAQPGGGGSADHHPRPAGSCIESEPEAAAVCPLLLDTESQPHAQFFHLPTPSTGLDLNAVEIDKAADAVPVEYATFEAFLVRKYFVKGINYLDERYGEFWSDAELCYQIRRAGRRLLVLPQVTALYTSNSPYSESSKNILDADRVHGLAVYFGKHYGFVTALLFRLKSILKALFSLRLSLFVALVSGTKIDGSQSEIL